VIEGTPWWHGYFLPKRVDAQAYADRPKCNGYVSRTNKGTRHWKRRNEPRNHAPRRIHSTRRVHAKGTRRRKNERSP